MLAHELESAYDYCLYLTRKHYENFPVASRLLQKELRTPISVIYAFARTADDFADEGDLTPEQRLEKLNAYDTYLDKLEAGGYVDDPVFVALRDVVGKWKLPWQPFHDLLFAFKMDVTQKRYNTFDDVLNYCHYSANPVGRLLLHLFKKDSTRTFEQSDAICTSLQLINFLQDIVQDYRESGRIYLPQQDMARFCVTEQHIHDQINDSNMRQLIEFQITRTRRMMLAGAPLGDVLPGRAGLEIRAIVNGGLRILDKLQLNRDNVYARPRLSKLDWLMVLYNAVKRK